MRCAIWYHLHNLKKVKNTHCSNGTKSRNAPHIVYEDSRTHEDGVATHNSQRDKFIQKFSFEDIVNELCCK